MDSKPILEISNLSKKYSGVQALDSVSFNINHGEVHAIVGENGAGKSTFIKILSGAVKPDSGGQIRYKNTAYEPKSPKEALELGISTIYQIMNLLPDRSIAQNVMLGKEPGGNGLIDNESLHHNTREILKSLKADHLDIDQPVRDLRVGEKQIVEIAKSLVNKSSLLIMDEPTAALNLQEVSALFSIIKDLRKQGVTIIYVSHRLDEIYELADSVTVLRDGNHILTKALSEVDRSELIESMIGRKLTDIYPKNKPSIGDVFFEVKGLSTEKGIDNIDFSLSHGEILAITGLSGSGKSILGKALFGATPITSGTVVLNNQTLVLTPEKCIQHGVMMLPEDRKEDSMLKELSIKRNLSLSVLRSRASNQAGILINKKENEIAEEQVKALGIKASTLDQNVMHLSGGNQQKVALGRCLAVDPQIFILLEPTQGIDVGVKFEIYRFIIDQASKGKGIVFISSELQEVMGLSHRVIVMRDGHIAADLETAQTNQEEILKYALGEI